jgi:hypothetical protein
VREADIAVREQEIRFPPSKQLFIRPAPACRPTLDGGIMFRARARLAFAAALTALALGALPATAGTQIKPELVDQAGDANFANSQGLGGIIGDEAVVTPVQADSADLRAMWLETIFDETVTLDDEGNEVVTKVATGLRWNVETTAPASPSFGPTVLFRMPITFSGCNAFLESQVRGPGSSPTDVQRASLRLLTADACGGPARSLNTGFTQSFDGNVMRIEFPFSATDGQLREGLTLAANGAGHVRTVLVAATAPAIDEAPGTWAFRIGSDR